MAKTPAKKTATPKNTDRKGVKLTKAEQEKLKGGLVKASSAGATSSAVRPSSGVEAAASKRCW